jgi:hypothetical protein
MKKQSGKIQPTDSAVEEMMAHVAELERTVAELKRTVHSQRIVLRENGIKDTKGNLLPLPGHDGSNEGNRRFSTTAETEQTPIEEDTGLIRRGNGSRKRPGYEARPNFLISDSSAELNLQDGNDGIPMIEDERFCATRHQYPQGLMRCSYGKVVDQHYLIWSLAWGMFNALVMILDAMSDLYLCMQLFVEPMFEDSVEFYWKLLYTALVATGISCWVGVAMYQTHKYGEYYLHASLKDHSWLDRKGYVASLFLCYLCNMPSYLLVLGRRLVKVGSVPDGNHHNFYFLLAYQSKHDWETRMQYGLLSHTPIFFLKDIPAIMLNVFFLTKVQ